MSLKRWMAREVAERLASMSYREAFLYGAGMVLFMLFMIAR